VVTSIRMLQCTWMIRSYVKFLPPLVTYCHHDQRFPRLTFGPLLDNARIANAIKKGRKDSPYSITERMIHELIPAPGSQPAGNVSRKPGGSLPLLSVRPAVTLATLKRVATNFAAW